jgi:hypothetical protein
VNPLFVARKPFLGNLRAMLLKKSDVSGPAMPDAGQTMLDAVLQRMILVALATMELAAVIQ